MFTPPTRSIATLLVAVLALAACGGGDSTATDPGVASLTEQPGQAANEQTTGTDEPDEADEGDEALAPEDAELAFAAYDDCMKEAGFDFGSSLGDSEELGDGEGALVQEFEVEADPQGGGLDTFDLGEEFTAADEECSKHLGGLDLSFDMSPEEEAAFEDAQIEWAECMRERGVEIPEIDGDGSSGVIIIGGADGDADPQGGFSTDDFDVEAFNEADEECSAAFEQLEERFGTEEGS